MLEGIPTGVLQETKMGERGFKKDGVTTYIEELLQKISKLEEENADLSAAGDKQESQLIQQYRTDLDNAQKKASEAIKQAQEKEMALQAANDKATQLAAALKTEKEERSTDAQKMKQLLQQAQAQTASADEGKIREYQEEILSLKGEISKLKAGESTSEAMASTVKELQDKLKKVQDEQAAREEELADKEEALAGMQNELNDLGGQIFAKDMQIDDLQSKVDELQSKVEELESHPAGASFIAPEMDMSAIWAGAQKQANEFAQQAKAAADKMTKDAEAKAKKTVEDADAKAEQTIKDADAKAKKTTEDADAAAKKVTEEADAAAKKTREDADAESAKIMKEAEDTLANAKAEAEKLLTDSKQKAEEESVRIKADAVEQEKRVRELTSTLRSMLTREIEGLAKSVKEASEQMTEAASQVNEKFSSMDTVIAEARSSVENTTKLGEEKIDAIMKGESTAAAPEKPSAPAQEKQEPIQKNNNNNNNHNNTSNANNNNNNSNANKENHNSNNQNQPKPNPNPSNKPASVTKDDFAQSMMEDFAAVPNPENNFKKSPLKDNGPTQMPKKPQKLNFDMTELIKDAEASMSE